MREAPYTPRGRGFIPSFIKKRKEAETLIHSMNGTGAPSAVFGSPCLPKPSDSRRLICHAGLF